MGLVDGKAGIVTGSAGGIGSATAIRLAGEGAAVVVTDLESRREAGEAVVGRIEDAGGRGIFVAADVSNEDDQKRLVAACVSAFGRLDFAHNNAGIDHVATVEETSVEDWHRVLDVNLMGVWLGMKHQIPQMRAQGGGGSIVNTASLAGLLGFAHFAAYVASKFGVVGVTKAAAVEASDAAIRVNVICPPAVKTEMIQRLDPEIQARLTGPQLIQRLAEPHEVAEAVVWLVSDRSSLVTGVTFPIELGSSAGVLPH
jgi:NAD(P)-dependent dehydrogenase (short-subunit alcohol dehydrogenase family)